MLYKLKKALNEFVYSLNYINLKNVKKISILIYVKEIERILNRTHFYSWEHSMLLRMISCKKWFISCLHNMYYA